MLAHRRHRVHAVVKGAVAPGRQQGRNVASRRTHGLPALSRLQLRMRPQIGHVVHAGVGNLCLVKPRHHLLGAELAKQRQDDVPERLAVLVTPGIAVKARVHSERRILQHQLAKCLPFALVLQPQHHRAAIACGEWSIRVDAGVGGCSARRWCGAVVGVIQRVAHPLAQGLQHRDINVRAPTGAPAQQQRRQNIRVGIHARSNVGHRVAGLAWRLGRAGDRQETGLALDQQIVGFFIAVRPVLAVTRNITHDQAGVDRTQRRIAQAHARSRAGRQILHQHVGLAQQRFKRSQGTGLFQVQRQAFLGPVGPDKV